MPLRCLLFGHAWHNDQDDAVTHIAYDEPCERRDCPATRNPRPVEPSAAALRRMAVQINRETLADLIHDHRLDKAGVDSFYAGMRHAEQLIRNTSLDKEQRHG